MKYFVSLTILVTCVIRTQQMLFTEQTKIWQNINAAYMETCVDASGVNRHLAERMSSYGEFVNDPALKCFAKCVAQSWGVANDDGTTRPDAYLNLISVNDPTLVKASGIEKKCFPIVVENEACETVFQVWKCTWDSLHEAYSEAELSLRSKQTFSDLKTMWHGNMLKYYHVCLNDTGAEPTIAIRMMIYGDYAEDHRVMCFLKCVMRKFYMVDDEGDADPEMIRRMIQIHDESVLTKLDIANRCYHCSKYADPCEKAFRTSQCAYYALKDYFDADENARKQEL